MYIILLIAIFFYLSNAARVSDGLIMEYTFANQTYSGLDCNDMPTKVYPSFSSGIDLGYLELQTAANDDGCKTEFVKEHIGLHIRPEEIGGTDTWRVKSEKDVSEIVDHLASDNNGYTIEMWVAINNVQSAKTSLLSIIDPIVNDNPSAYDNSAEVLAETEFTDLTPNLLNSKYFAKCLDAHDDEKDWYKYDPASVRISLDESDLYMDEKSSSGAENLCVKEYGGIFNDPMNYYPDGETQPLTPYHIALTQQYIGGGFYKYYLYANGTGSPELAESGFVNAPNDLIVHSWESNHHLEIGHQFATNATDFHLLFFAMYDKTLSDTDIQVNYDAGLPNSAPYVLDQSISADEEACVPITLEQKDWDTQLYEQWTGHDFPGIISAKSVPSTVDKIYINNVDLSVCSLFTDASCTSEINVTVSEYEYASTIYFKSISDIHGTFDNVFSAYATDGIDNGGVTKFTVQVNPINDAPVANDLSFDAYAGVCTGIYLQGDDIDGDDEINEFTIETSLVGIAGGLTGIYSDSACTTSLAASSTISAISNNDTLVIYYKAYDVSSDSALETISTDSFTYSVEDIYNEASNIATVTVNIKNSVYSLGDIDITVNEHSNITIYFKGDDYAYPSDNDNLNVLIYSNPNGTLYSTTTNEEITKDDGNDYYEVDAANCLHSDTNYYPCLIYQPVDDSFGSDIDSFTFSFMNQDGLRSDNESTVMITVINDNDAPVLLCPNYTLDNLQSGESDIIDTFNPILTDVDLPDNYERYYMKIYDPDEIVRFSLPNGDGYNACIDENTCCDNTCEIIVKKNNVFANEFPQFTSDSEFYASWQSLNDILNEINVRASSNSEHGDGNIYIIVKDEGELNATCTISYSVTEALAFDLNNIGQDRYSKEVKFGASGAIIILIILCCICCCKKRSKKKKKNNTVQHMELDQYSKKTNTGNTL